MNDQQVQAIRECAALSRTGAISFGDVVARLIQAGIERYHADYTRMESTYYLPNGESRVLPIDLPPTPIAETFSADGVRAAVRKAQRGELVYPQFVAHTTLAGCVGYFVQLAGQRVQYFGRHGDLHTEWFPGAEPK